MARGGVPGGAYKMRSRVIRYWAPILARPKDFDSIKEFSEEGTCFACTWRYKVSETQVAHILAKCNGGTDEASNLHILCAPCHHDSEALSGDAYWEWFLKRSQMDGLFRHFMASGGSLSDALRKTDVT